MIVRLNKVEASLVVTPSWRWPKFATVETGSDSCMEESRVLCVVKGHHESCKGAQGRLRTSLRSVDDTSGPVGDAEATAQAHGCQVEGPCCQRARVAPMHEGMTRPLRGGWEPPHHCQMTQTTLFVAPTLLHNNQAKGHPTNLHGLPYARGSSKATEGKSGTSPIVTKITSDPKEVNGACPKGP